MYKGKRKFQTVYVDNKMVKSCSTSVSIPLLNVIFNNNNNMKNIFCQLYVIEINDYVNESRRKI